MVFIFINSARKGFNFILKLTRKNPSVVSEPRLMVNSHKTDLLVAQKVKKFLFLLLVLS